MVIYIIVNLVIKTIFIGVFLCVYKKYCVRE